MFSGSCCCLNTSDAGRRLGAAARVDDRAGLGPRRDAARRRRQEAGRVADDGPALLAGRVDGAGRGRGGRGRAGGRPRPTATTTSTTTAGLGAGLAERLGLPGRRGAGRGAVVTVSRLKVIVYFCLSRCFSSRCVRARADGRGSSSYVQAPPRRRAVRGNRRSRGFENWRAAAFTILRALCEICASFRSWLLRFCQLNMCTVCCPNLNARA